MRRRRPRSAAPAAAASDRHSRRRRASRVAARPAPRWPPKPSRRDGLRRAGRGAERARRGRRDREAAQLRRATRPTCWRRRPARPSVFRVRIGKFKTRREAETDRGQAAEGRAVQALGHALTRYARAPALAAPLRPSARPQLSESSVTPRCRLDRAGAAARRAPGRGRFAAPFCSASSTGVVYFTGTLYWITRVMAVYGGLQTWVAVLINARADRVPGALSRRSSR